MPGEGQKGQETKEGCDKQGTELVSRDTALLVGVMDGEHAHKVLRPRYPDAWNKLPHQGLKSSWLSKTHPLRSLVF